MVYQNVVIGKPELDIRQVIALDNDDWDKNEKPVTLFTETRFLPVVMKEAGIVDSISEVRRNRKDLVINLDQPDCLTVKWGKKRLFIVVGGKTNGSENV